MNGVLERGPGLALGACFVAGWVGLACGQVQVVIDGQLQFAGPVAGNVPPGDAPNDAIGDPWWDDAEGRAKAGLPAEAGDDAADEEDRADAADPRALIEMQTELIRRNLDREGLAILRRELSIVREACPELEPRERAAIIKAGRDAIGKLAEDRNAKALRWRRGRDPELEKAIAAALQASLTTAAGPPGAAAYARERGLRAERAKQATIAALVAEVDRDAALEAAEQEALAKVLAESYRERWRHAVAQAGLGAAADVLFQGLDRCVEQALGEARKAEWLARREEARNRTAIAGGQGVQIMGAAGGVDAPVPIPDAAGRVIQRRIINNGGGMQLRIEVRVGGDEAAAGEAAGDDQEP